MLLTVVVVVPTTLFSMSSDRVHYFLLFAVCWEKKGSIFVLRFITHAPVVAPVLRIIIEDVVSRLDADSVQADGILLVY